MAIVATVLLTASLFAGDEPALCSNLDIAQVSIIAGQVQRRTVRSSGSADITYEITAVVRPTHTLRGASVTRPVTVRDTCTVAWWDLGGRRFCSSLLAGNVTEVFQVDRRTFTANRNPDRDEVADYDRRVTRPLPRCSR